MSDKAPLLVALAEATEASVLAARSLQGARLQELKDERTRLLFELRCAEPLDATDPEVLAVARRLRTAERRLERVCGAVLDVIGLVAPAAPPARYGRGGRLAP